MSREEAEHNGENPCPRCFPDSEYGKRFDVTEMPGGVTRYMLKDSGEYEK